MKSCKPTNYINVNLSLCVGTRHEGVWGGELKFQVSLTSKLDGGE